MWAGAAALALLVLANTFFVVPMTGQVMVLQLGRVVRLEPEPGLHTKIPFLQQLMRFDRRILETDSPPEEVQTLDKKRVVVDSFTRWRIVDAAEFYRSVRSNPVAVLRLNTIVNSGMRSVVASVPLQALVSTSRTEVMGRILKVADGQARELGIQVVDVRLKRADLPPENSEAVFRRMRAERQKEAQEIRAEGGEAAQRITADAERQRTVLLANAERDAQKLRGEGDGQALRVAGSAFAADPGFYRLTKGLAVYRTALPASNTTFVLDPGTGFLDTMVGK